MPDRTGGSDFALFNFTLAFPCWRAVGGDDAFAALEGFGDDKAEVLGEGRKDKNIAPIPDALQLVAKGVADDAKLHWTLIIICGSFAGWVRGWIVGASSSGGEGGWGA